MHALHIPIINYQHVLLHNTGKHQDCKSTFSPNLVANPLTTTTTAAAASMVGDAASGGRSITVGGSHSINTSTNIGL